MPKKANRRNTCRVCSSKKLIKIISLGNLYLSDFVSDNTKPQAYPLSLILCSECLLVQLEHTTPPSLLYTESYGYKSGINNTMKKELAEIARKAMRKIGKTSNKIVVLDIGANDGTLLSSYPKNIVRVAVEPIKKLAAESKRHANYVINDFFNYKAFKKAMGNKKAMIITAISCFYDIDEPNKFVSDIAKILEPKGVFVIQQNYLKSMLELNAFDNIVHEHLEYYSLHSLSNLLRRHGLEVFDVEENKTNGGSFRTYIAFKNKRKVEKSVEAMLQKEKKALLDTKIPYKAFATRIQNNRSKLREFVNKKVLSGKTIYIYGASTRGNTLIQYLKLNKKLIKAAAERNPEKFGKKIASVGIPIISEEEARKQKPDYMLVLPWFFKEEFLAREKAYLESGGHFIFPLPDFEIV